MVVLFLHQLIANIFILGFLEVIADLTCNKRENSLSHNTVTSEKVRMRQFLVWLLRSFYNAKLFMTSRPVSSSSFQSALSRLPSFEICCERLLPWFPLFVSLTEATLQCQARSRIEERLEVTLTGAVPSSASGNVTRLRAVTPMDRRSLSSADGVAVERELDVVLKILFFVVRLFGSLQAYRLGVAVLHQKWMSRCYL